FIEFRQFLQELTKFQLFVLLLLENDSVVLHKVIGEFIVLLLAALRTRLSEDFAPMINHLPYGIPSHVKGNIQPRIIGGSQREERYDRLLKRVQELNLPEKDLWWYMELRKFGSAPHSGFGLGFERLIQFVTGMTNIRDVIPFPRYPGNAEF
ncbi:MAG: amino acid--tRNA ligase-related protein, partial [Cyclobacteriaceae bacterium]